MISSKLFKRQLELEQEGIQRGIEKCRKEVMEAKAKGSYDTTKSSSIIIYQLMQPFCKGLLEFISARDFSKNEKVTKDFILKAKIEKVAFITLKELLANVVKGDIEVISLCMKVAEAIEADTIIEAFKGLRSDKDDYTWGSYVDYVLRAKSKLGSCRTRTKKLLELKMRDIGFTPDRLDREELIFIGQKILAIFMENTGLIMLAMKPTGKGKLSRIVSPTQAFMDYLNKIEGECEILSPILYPMLIPPVPHSKGKKAGFITPAIQVPLVKDYRNEVKPYLKEVDMPRVYEAINHIQNTAWRINKDVLNVLTQLMNEGQAIKELDIVSGTEVEVPPKPWGVLSDEEYRVYKLANPEIVKTWKVKARDIYNQNASDKSKRILYKSLVSMTTKFKDEERFYYCYNLDWRGRVYPIQSGGCPNPQGLDVSKALIEFADGLALGEHGEYWLSVQGANTFGDDKLPMDERGAWARANEQKILEVAADPFSNKWWWEADESWKFLAFCFEWAKYKASGYSRDFISHLPVALDGSCSGIQHFSALLLDERGAKATNVISTDEDKPSDIYAEVAKVVSAKVEEDAKAGIPEAIILRGKIDRSICKRNVMTTPYGVTSRGMTDQLLEELKDRKEEFSSDIVSIYDVCRYLAEANLEAIGKVILASRVVMDWLRDIADVMQGANKTFQWITPSGFVVEQKYNKSTTQRVSTFWGGTRVRLNVVNSTPRLDHKKIKQGQSPNYIHSMDAAHLMLTVNACWSKGIKSFALIHDSFATHAGATDTLAQTLREEFVKMYSIDNLARFQRHIFWQIEDEKIRAKLPPVPTRGTLDIQKVLTSKYFFS